MRLRKSSYLQQHEMRLNEVLERSPEIYKARVIETMVRISARLDDNAAELLDRARERGIALQENTQIGVRERLPQSSGGNNTRRR
ncbi:hypothetical protein ACFLX5_03740 [Chloroflexota bacterium]